LPNIRSCKNTKTTKATKNARYADCVLEFAPGMKNVPGNAKAASILTGLT
jgi:hypothetical protein